MKNINTPLRVIAVVFWLLGWHSSYAQYNYNEALEKAVLFFDANKCGPDVADNNGFSDWRGACHLDDGAAVGVDLTGGFHDAGDHVKFGLPQTWSAATLGWALYEYRSVFDEAGVTPKLLSTLKYFTDYFLKSHPDANTFYYNIGDGNADHAYWGPPEDQTGARPVIAATPATPASDVCGEAAAALALMYLNSQDTDPAYAQRCLKAAVSIYKLGKDNLGRSSDGGGGSFYKSSSHFDDLGWGAIWLSVATGDDTYLEPVDAWLEIPNDYGDDNYDKHWAPAWDDVTVYVLLKMHQLTGNQKYQQGVVNNLEWYRDDCRRTPFGLPWLDNWGVLRYASSEAGVGYAANKIFGYDGYLATGDLTMDYCLGTNPRNSSYVTGYGKNPPVHPHHRANQPDYYFPNTGKTNGMVGGLVGGPTQDDGYTDAIADFQRSEVGIDYNASYVLGLAGKIFTDGGGGGTPTNKNPVAAVTATPITGKAPLVVEFDGSASADPDGDALTFRWNFGDSTSSTESSASHTYTATGSYTATLTVSDGNGGTGSKSVTIDVTGGGTTPGPMAVIKVSATSGSAPLVVSFDGTNPEATITGYAWDFGDGTTGEGAKVEHTYTSTGRYVATLTVTGAGKTDQATTTINVTDGNPTACGNYLTASGNQLYDVNGKEVRLTGINWFGFETSLLLPHGVWNRDFRSMLQQIKDLGFNSLRIPWTNRIMDADATIRIDAYGTDPYTGVSPMNEKEAAFTKPLQLMDALVAWCQENDMKIVLDNHSRQPDGYLTEALWYTASVSEQRWIDDWVALAERYKDYDAVIGMDLNNEPHDEASWGNSSPATDWNQAAERCGNAILKVNPHVLIMVEGVEMYEGENYWWGGNLKGAADYPVQLSDPAKLVYSPHEYGPTVFAQPWFSAPDFPANMPAIWEEHFGYLYDNKVSPLYNGEFGLKTQGGPDEVWFDTWLQYMGADYSWAYWCWNPNSGDTGGILTDDWSSINEWKMDKLRPYLADVIPNTGGSGDCDTDLPPNGDDQLALSSSSVSFDAAADTSSITVTATGSWEVSTGSAWITVSPARGEGNGLFTVAVTGNSGSARSGTLTVTSGALSKTVSVSQVTDTGGTTGCSFGTPLASALPTISNSTYEYAYTLGEGGPDLSNVTRFTINWSLADKGLWQLSMQTNNGQPNWWNDLLGKATHTLASAQPGVTLTGTGFPGLDGAYYVNVVDGDFVMVSQTGNYSIYFSNAATAPSCGPAATKSGRTSGQRTAATEVVAYPNPFDRELHVTLPNPEKVSRIVVVDQLGQEVLTLNKFQVARENVIYLSGYVAQGVYLVKITGEEGVTNLKVIKK